MRLKSIVLSLIALLLSTGGVFAISRVHRRRGPWAMATLYLAMVVELLVLGVIVASTMGKGPWLTVSMASSSVLGGVVVITEGLRRNRERKQAPES